MSQATRAALLNWFVAAMMAIVYPSHIIVIAGPSVAGALIGSEVAQPMGTALTSRRH